MAIRFFFEYDGTVVQLPVNPETISIASSGNNKTEEIVKLGEINILKQPKLTGCQIQCFFPKTSAAPYVLTAGRFEAPQFYIDFFNRIRNDKKPCRFIISDTNVNMLVSIENFEWSLKAQDEDTHYKLDLKEYRTYNAKVVKIASTTTGTTTTQRPQPSTTNFAIGDKVIANGKYWYDSYGASPFGTFKNFTGKISNIKKDRKYGYHITTLNGGWRGWVSKDQITRA